MPCPDTGDFSETLVGLSWEFLSSPTMRNTLETVALSNSNNVDVLVLFEDVGDSNGLLEEAMSVGDLVRDRSPVHLDFHEMSLLLTQPGLADLSVSENTDDGAVFANTLELAIS